MMTKNYKFLIFDGETPANNTITTQDIAPEISIDKAYGLRDSVRKLTEALGIQDVQPLSWRRVRRDLGLQPCWSANVRHSATCFSTTTCVSWAGRT